MDTTQLLLTIILSLTTVLLIVVGVQLIFVLRELRALMRNVNKVVEGFESLGVGLDHGLTEVVGFVNGFKSLMRVIETVNPKKHEKSK